MKKSLLFLVLLNCFMFAGIAGNKNKNKNADSLLCLEISGRVSNFKLKQKVAYKVELISYNKIIDSVTINDKSDFKFILKRDCHYAIRISAPGYITRLVSVYTNISPDINAFYRFQFDTELIESHVSKKLDSDALDFPIAVISFHDDIANFYYSEEYTANLKRQLYLRQSF